MNFRVEHRQQERTLAPVQIAFIVTVLLSGWSKVLLAATKNQPPPAVKNVYSQGSSGQEPKDLSPLPPAGPSSKILTWDDCVAFAAARNPSLIAADWAQKASRQSYFSSYNGILPTVNLLNSYTAGNVLTNGKPLYTGQAVAAINLFNMTQVANIRTAKANYSQAQANQRTTSANLLFNLRSAFANVYFTQESVEVARRIETIQKRNAEMVTLRYQSGREYKGNMMNAKAQYLVQQINVKQAVRSLRAAEKQLDQFLGLDEFEHVVVTGTLVAQRPPDFPGHMQDFLEDRPDVALQEAVVAGARASLASAEAPLFPTLSANYTRSRTGPTEFPSQNYLWTAGVTLSYPLFAGGPTSAFFNIRAAKDTLRDQEESLRATKLAALQNLENSWANYANAVDQAIGEQAILESYRQRNDEAGVRYGAGLLTFDNFQIIVTQWINAEGQSLNNWQQAVTAQAQWEQALGKALGE